MLFSGYVVLQAVTRDLSGPHLPTATRDAEHQADTREHHGVGLWLWNRSEVSCAVLSEVVDLRFTAVARATRAGETSKPDAQCLLADEDGVANGA